ncbi:sigma-70 family RNA polymerase sigma factor [Pedobacter sp. MC2016-14]|uniref:RNA polymerase sigma factor n=1 Tax=Pedobacter sp. MC2016-14 TaxID=2897327 RepID=UPI001E2CC355|nr:sigma-70 family RNA polymerase sigma factor [Pedobacter sp. MC2016-14]MCD0488094.1 sigma-70 family RNA polymerase sigma factor [Pedobacter sp. MC2016-14]
MDFPDDEKALLTALKDGDAVAFEVLYAHYSKSIFRRLVRMVKHIPLAEELTQDVFVKIWDKRVIIDIEKPFYYYILTIASHLVNDFYRKAARDQRLQDEILAASAQLYNPTEEFLFYKESEQVLNKAIDDLPPQQQLVFRRCKIEGKSYKEVAEEFNISTSTVSNHIVKATASIKKVFFGSKYGFLVLAISLLSNKG